MYLKRQHCPALRITADALAELDYDVVVRKFAHEIVPPSGQEPDLCDMNIVSDAVAGPLGDTMDSAPRMTVSADFSSMPNTTRWPSTVVACAVHSRNACTHLSRTSRST